LAKQIAPPGYGLLGILLHWITAVAVFGLFALGLWMVDLGYYHAWYNRAPDIHRSIGILLAILVIARIAWRMGTTLPEAPPNHKPWERIAAKVTHALLYILMLGIFLSGYLITSAKGQAVQVFDWFSIPAILSSVENLEDSSGLVHEIAAFVLIGLTALHAAAAAKHHFIDRDTTLRRIFKP
jgi:cytochrome b561